MLSLKRTGVPDKKVFPLPNLEVEAHVGLEDVEMFQ